MLTGKRPLTACHISLRARLPMFWMVCTCLRAEHFFLHPKAPSPPLSHFALIKSGMLLYFTYRFAWMRN